MHDLFDTRQSWKITCQFRVKATLSVVIARLPYTTVLLSRSKHTTLLLTTQQWLLVNYYLHYDQNWRAHTECKPLPCHTMISTLAVYGWAVTFATARRGRSGCDPPPSPLLAVPVAASHPSTASVPTSYYYIILYSYYIIIVALWLPGPVKWLTKQCAFTVKAFAIKYSIQTTNSIM